MAEPYNPPVKNENLIIYTALQNMAIPGSFKVNPTIAVGDFKISGDDGALSNLGTLPVVSPAGSIWVKIEVSAGEMNVGNAKIQGIDQTSPKEWGDWGLCIPTTSA